MFQLECKKWIRSKYIFFLTFFLVMLAFLSVLSSFYINDILESLLAQGQMKIAFQEVTWSFVLKSFFKNSSQLGLFLAAYMILNLANLGQSESLQLFYQTRSRDLLRIYWPKYLAALLNLVLALSLAFLTALYLLVLLFDKIDLSMILYTASLHFLVFLLLISILFFLHILLVSPFALTLAMELVIMLLSAFQQIEVLQKFSGIHLLLGSHLADKAIQFEELDAWALASLSFLLLLVLLLVWLKSLFLKLKK